MEEICTALSNVLCDNGTGGYKIYYEEELLDALPENIRNRETLEAALKNLNGGGYIDVKYARGSAFCIAAYKKFAPTVKEQPAVTAAETSIQSSQSNSLNFPKKLYAAITACAFIGGLIGGILAVVLGAVL